MAETEVSLKDMATWLSWPSVLGEFRAEPLAGVGIGYQSYTAPHYQPAVRAADLSAVFRQAIAELVSPFSSVAISISGGLDSAAVLVHLAEMCKASGTELHLLTAELLGDDSSTNIHHIERILDGLGIDAPVHRIGAHGDADRRGQRYFWSPSGPRLDSSPDVNDALVDKAGSLGAQAVFTGAGSDELIGVVRYMLWPLLAQGKLSMFRSYWGDSISVSRQAAVLEALAPVMQMLPRRWRAVAYYAITPDPPVELAAPDLVTGQYRGHIEDWSRAWMNRRLDLQASAHSSWRAMEAWESLDPVCPPIVSSDPMPFLHPFMSKSFVEAVMQTPLESRYNPELSNSYWRQKSIVLDLIGRQHWAHLPTKKQIFSGWMQDNQADTADSISFLVELGLVDQAQLGATQNTMLLHRVAALESWALVARDRGYDFVA